MTAEPPDGFRNPEARFRTAAFWFWHRIPTDREIGTQLADMRNKGIGCVMVQARPALALSDYLSPAYLAAYRAACAQATRFGLAVMIYDEYGWMSGHGGGRTVEGADHLRERHLFWTAGRAGDALAISGIRSPFLDFLGETGRCWVYDGAGPRWGDWRIAAAIAHPPAIGDPTEIRLLSGAFAVAPDGPDGCRVVAVPGVAIPDGWQVTVFVSARCLTSRLVNYLLTESAERFADVVYAPLVEAADGAAEGLFFDHPYAGFYIWNEHGGALGNSLLSDGEPIGEAEAAALLSLARDVGPATAGLRAGHLEAYAERLHRTFFGTLSRWAGDRGLGFTGHELLTHVGGWSLHGGLTGIDPRVMPGVDYFGIDAYRTQTSVDAADFAPQLAAKLGDSVARANGRRRCALEQYATGREGGRPTLAGQWDLDPRRFRTQAIRHLLLGARRLVLHALNVTDGFDGDERLLANPRFDFPPAYNFQPWWEDCGAIFDELARLSAFLEEGEPLRPVALLYPLETIRAEGPAHACGDAFGWWAEALAQAGIGYDILDERTLAADLAPGGRYDTLVVPGATALARLSSLRAIEGFARTGSRVLWSGSPCAQVRERGEGAPVSLESSLERVGGTAGEIQARVATLPRPRTDARFADGDPIWSSLARCGTDWRIAVLNEADHARRLTVAVEAPAFGVSLWDPATGKTDVATRAEAVDGGFALALSPRSVVCVVVHEAGAASVFRPASPPGATDPRLVVDLADGWTLQIGQGPPVSIAVDRGWEAQGFAAFSGTGIYRTRIAIPDRPVGTAWHLEITGLCASAEVRLDGARLGTALGAPATFALPSAASGTAALEIRVRNTAANRYYGGTSYAGRAPQPSGLTAVPRLVAIDVSG